VMDIAQEFRERKIRRDLLWLELGRHTNGYVCLLKLVP